MSVSKYFKYYQPNNKDIKDESNDGYVRTLSKVLNRTWIDTFDILTRYCREAQVMPWEKKAYQPLLKDYGFEYRKLSIKRGDKRPTVESFTKSHRKGVFVVVIANHIVPVVNGQYFDTWDWGDASLYGYWEKVDIVQ